MDFFNDELHQEMVDMYRNFAEGVCGPIAAEIDEAAETRVENPAEVPEDVPDTDDAESSDPKEDAPEDLPEGNPGALPLPPPVSRGLSCSPAWP